MRRINVIGGGLAGLTLGIGLRRLGVPVTVWEAGHYPRHRVCGEFVSGKGQEALRRLGLEQRFMEAGALLAREASFFLGKAESRAHCLDPAAWCLSRFTIDQLLANCFQTEGGDLRQNSRWQGEDAEATVWTCGRQAQSAEQEWRWFGIKIHARGVQLRTDLEMHGAKNGYVGLCRLPGGEINVCGLFRTRRGSPIGSQPAREWLRGEPGTSLRWRLANAVFLEETFCAVAGLGLRPQKAAAQRGCRLGDALTLIPPVTGNGMSMAFEAADIALEPLAAYARSELDWEKARTSIARQCDAAFRRRLAWATCLHWMMFSPILRGQFGSFALRSRWLWQLFFTRTR